MIQRANVGIIYEPTKFFYYFSQMACYPQGH